MRLIFSILITIIIIVVVVILTPKLSGVKLKGFDYEATYSVM